MDRRKHTHTHTHTTTTSKTWKCLIKKTVPVLFSRNVENPKQHAFTGLPSKRGIPCNRGGAYLSEYNLQFIKKVEPFPERTMRTIHENYAEVCND